MPQLSRIKISAGDRLRCRIVLPASKSISNRALLINALSGNTIQPANLSDSDDTQVMLKALQGDSERPIDIGAAGTAMRFLTAYLSVTPGEHIITGSERMKQRPIGILVDALRQLGASIEYEGEEGFPPLRIVGHKNLKGGELTVPGDVSSQYISALLMIAPTLQGGLRLTLTGKIASRPYLEMTISMMRDFGAEVEWTDGNVIEVKPGAYLQRPYTIESDWSAASYWYEMVALTRDASAMVDLVGLHHDSIQGDSKVFRMMSELGVETSYYFEPDGTEVIRLNKTQNITCYFSQDFTHQPDLAQTFAVTCAMLDVPFRLVGLGSLRIKETDRIKALAKELGKIVFLEEKESELLWDGCYSFDDDEDVDMMPYGKFVFDTYDDHRMAMALAPICLRTGGQVQINNPEVVSKSYPGFWDDLQKAGFNVCR